MICSPPLTLKIKELILLLLQSANSGSLQQLFTTIFTPAKIALSGVIQAHLYSDHTIGELAKLSGLSISSFKREFQREFNMSPGKYIIEKRIEKARQLLETGNFTVAEVAYEVGFTDPSYFSRAFKSKTGLTPVQFQRRKN